MNPQHGDGDIHARWRDPKQAIKRERAVKRQYENRFRSRSMSGVETSEAEARLSV